MDLQEDYPEGAINDSLDSPDSLGRFARGVSLPPTPAVEISPRNPWDSGRAVSVSRDSSPGGKRRFTRHV